MCICVPRETEIIRRPITISGDARGSRPDKIVSAHARVDSVYSSTAAAGVQGKQLSCVFVRVRVTFFFPLIKMKKCHAV